MKLDFWLVLTLIAAAIFFWVVLMGLRLLAG